MKIAVVGLFHETNTFAPEKTDVDDFSWGWVVGNAPFYNRYEHTRTSMGGVIDGARSEQAELICGAYISATPSGMVSRAAANAIFEALPSSLDTNVDGIVAILHGAMVAEGFPDMEGEIIRQIREKVGSSIPLAITLDLHANISRQMIDQIDIVVGYDTYPHIDPYERAIEAVQLLARMIRGEIRPVRSLAKPHLLIAPQVMMTDEEGPMKQLLDEALAMERDPKVLNVTVAGGFPYSDVPDAGMTIVVTTNADQMLADHYAGELSRMAWDLREQLIHSGLTAAEAVSAAIAEDNGPVILVESSDNVGGGSPADATHLLKHLIGVSKKCLIVVRDVEAVQFAHRLGVGGRFDGAIGGKIDKLHGEPVRIQGSIRLLFDGKYSHIGSYMTGLWANMGKTAVIETGNLTIMLTEHRTVPWDPGHVASVGLRPEDFHVIVVKAAIAWKTAFGSVYKKTIQVDTPGCCSHNLFHFNYENINRPIYPFDPIV